MCLERLKKYRAWGPSVLRLVAGIIFILAGWAKLTGIDGFVGMLSGAGFPLPSVFAWLVAIVEFLGGVLLILGLFTRWVAIPLGITMVVATLMMLGNGFDSARLPLTLLVVMVALLFAGAGALSLDGYFFKETLLEKSASSKTVKR